MKVGNGLLGSDLVTTAKRWRQFFSSPQFTLVRNFLYSNLNWNVPLSMPLSQGLSRVIFARVTLNTKYGVQNRYDDCSGVH